MIAILLAVSLLVFGIGYGAAKIHRSRVLGCAYSAASLLLLLIGAAVAYFEVRP